MKAMSFILKFMAVLGFVLGVICFLNTEIEVSIICLIVSVFVLAMGVLFRNLAEAFEDIRLMRERQKLELISKGVIKEEKNLDEFCE
jgi:hypothetical protein